MIIKSSRFPRQKCIARGSFRPWSCSQIPRLCPFRHPSPWVRYAQWHEQTGLGRLFASYGYSWMLEWLDMSQGRSSVEQWLNTSGGIRSTELDHSGSMPQPLILCEQVTRSSKSIVIVTQLWSYCNVTNNCPGSINTAVSRLPISISFSSYI